MTLAQAFALAFLCGFAVASASGNFAVWRHSAPAGLRPPYLTAGHVGRSLLLSIMAGPYLLLGELRLARSEHALAGFWIVAGFVLASLWMMASGIVILAASEQIAGLMRAG